MDFAIQVCSYLVGLPLELLTIAAMLRGGYKRYPLVFTYVIIFFLTTVVEMPSAVAVHGSAPPQTWSVNTAFASVIGAGAEQAKRQSERCGLIGVTIRVWRYR